MVCQAFAGYDHYRDFFELAVLVLSDGYGILCPYPLPQASNYGPITIFSPNVCVFYQEFLNLY